MSEPIPSDPSFPPPRGVTILTGFLGSGKTTLLNVLLHARHGLRLAVVVNEFGAVGVDGASVTGGERFVELDNGCLCCALNKDLEQTLYDLHQRSGFEHVIIETTGLADPLPIAWILNRPLLASLYRADAIVTVVDALNLQEALQHAPEATLQIQHADILVLNKLDLVSDQGAHVQTLIRSHNTLAPLLPTQHGQVPWHLIVSAPSQPSAASQASKSQEASFLHHHDPSFETWSFETEAIVSDEALEDFVYAIPPSIFRFKGWIRTDAPWAWTLVHAVAGRIDLRPAVPSYPLKRSCMVFIGRSLDKALLQRMCAALVDHPITTPSSSQSNPSF